MAYKRNFYFFRFNGVARTKKNGKNKTIMRIYTKNYCGKEKVFIDGSGFTIIAPPDLIPFTYEDANAAETIGLENVVVLGNYSGYVGSIENVCGIWGFSKLSIWAIKLITKIDNIFNKKI